MGKVILRPRPGAAASRGRRRRTGRRRCAVSPRPRLAKLERSKVPGLARNTLLLPCGLSSHWIFCFSVNKWKNPQKKKKKKKKKKKNSSSRDNSIIIIKVLIRIIVYVLD